MAALKFALFIEARRWLHQVGGGRMNIHVCRSPLFEPLLMPHQAACFQSRQTLICTDTQSMPSHACLSRLLYIYAVCEKRRTLNTDRKAYSACAQMRPKQFYGTLMTQSVGASFPLRPSPFYFTFCPKMCYINIFRAVCSR